MRYDIIIVGAGASGLMAARKLSAKGLSCCVLEAASKPGGRIRTFTESGFEGEVEAGAEFIHGKMPITLKLLSQAGIDHQETSGRFVHVRNGEWDKEDKDDEHDEDWGSFMKQLKKQDSDLVIEKFLNENFAAPEFESLRKSVRRFAEGFDLADPSKASMLTLRNEWKDMDEPQYRICGGYGKMIQFLEEDCRRQKVHFYYSMKVNQVEFQRPNVTVYTNTGLKFETGKLIVTVSPAVLQSGMIRFSPAIPQLEHVLPDIGFGSVIKILLQFNSPFWKEKSRDVGFILSDERIPTWWTQLPEKSNLFTGWVGGPPADEISRLDEKTVLNTAIESLASIFRLLPVRIEKELLHHKIICWANEPYVMGGYSYQTLYSEKAKKQLSEPIDQTIYFAGEALSSGESYGTVEAALESGLSTAKKILKDED